jgi:acid phosphatase type 7
LRRLTVITLTLAAAAWAASSSGPAARTLDTAGGPTGGPANAAVAGTVTKTFWPRADTRVEEANPSTNFGTATQLGVRGGATPDIESFLRFAVTGVWGPVQSVTLVLRTPTWSSAADGPAVYRTTGGWAETGITWSNRPARTSAAVDDKGAIAADSLVSYDVTSLVGGDGAYSFGLAGTSGDGVSFNSKEAAVERPRLVVTFLDDHPPNPPQNLRAELIDSTQAALEWDPATDDYGVAGYQVFRDGVSIATLGTQTSYLDSGILAGDRNQYTVRALDTVGSSSGPSYGATVTTPVTVTFAPRADARVEEASPTTNFGTLTKLAARGGTVPDVESFVRFGVTGVSGTVHSAELVLRTGNWTDAGTIDGPALYRTAANWTEDGITWSSRPARMGGVVDDQGPLGIDSPVTYDVSSVVQGDGLYSFSLASNSTDVAFFHSREVTVYRPVLVVRFLPPDKRAMTAGDIACDPSDTNFNGGQGTPLKCRQLHTSNLIQDAAPDAVLALGDLQYGGSTLGQFNGGYDPSWGRFRNLTRPVPGNHEYDQSGAAGYFDYWNGVGKAVGPGGDRAKGGYYSFDVGAWHVIALNSNCSRIGGCGPGSAQEQWLRRDLQATERACTLAYWHHPRFSSGDHSGSQSMQDIWVALYEAGADLVLTGHSHVYERFAPQNALGGRDFLYGMRQFVVGTGGRDLRSFSTPEPNSEVRDSGSFGALALTLRPGSYSWQFVPASPSTLSDSGIGACHNSPPPAAPAP